VAVSPDPVSFSEAFWFWFKLGFISFGGPARSQSCIRNWWKGGAGFPSAGFFMR
jgi:chromate transport protein ChrA